jgi:tetratricopeptide (TPR) repeat protein
VVEQTSGQPSLRPEAALWESLKKGSLGAPTVVTIEGFGNGEALLSFGELRFSTSADRVGDSLFFREVVLPFRQAVKDPSQLAWRFGSIATEGQPPVVLSNLPVCGNCHSFSADGSVLGMDVDYANDKGSYAMVPTAPEMELTADRVISWAGVDAEKRTFGLLPQLSPDGRFAVATVKDRSVFVAVDEDLAFSQLFFPVKGVLGWYDRQTKALGTLPGADDSELVQTNPVWTRDGQSLIFARAPKSELGKVKDPKAILVTKEEVPEFFGKDRQRVRYDLYRIPFNGGKGGKAQALVGASNNGKSNFFPRPSPDGRWLVFCKADSFMLLQPDTRLFIMPLAGGTPRELKGTPGGMNSWHSWSSNSRWLVFAAKLNGPYTQLFVTHIDQDGNDSVPVLLENFVSPERAANIPEFVPLAPDAIKRITPKFLDSESYLGAGQALVGIGERNVTEDLEKGLAMYRKALELKPKDPNAMLQVGLTLTTLGRTEEARDYLREAVRLDPTLHEAHFNLALYAENQGRLEEAEAGYRRAIDLKLEFVQARMGLVLLQLKRGLVVEARKGLEDILAIKPGWGHAHFYLGRIAMEEGSLEEARDHFQKAIEGQPSSPEPFWRLGVVYLLMDRSGAAEATLKKGLEAFQEDPALLDALAVAVARQGRLEEGRTLATKALAGADPARAGGLIKAIQRHLKDIQAGRAPQF